MSAEATSLLIQTTLASSAAMLLVTALRKGLRHVVGARVAYWAWLLVPAAALVLLLPQSSHSVRATTGALSRPVQAAMSGALHAIDRLAAPSYFGIAVVSIWMGGALLSLILMVRRHRAFVRSLGEATPQPDGSVRSAACSEPMLVGILRPRVVLPQDFDSRYGLDERAMVLAHEHTHLRRRDPQINALAALWVCLSWFNPLMHWALRLFRFDQELACDASVLAHSPATPRSYADALLKTQLTADLARRPAVLGCHWHSAHPLTERINMLKRPLPGVLRRRGGLAMMLVLVVSGCYAVRTAQSQAAAEQPLIAVNLKIFINGVDAFPEAAGRGWEFVASSGGQFVIGDAQHSASCVPRVAPAGGILFSCELSHPTSGVFSKPTLLVRDGEPSWIDVTDTEHTETFRLEFNASTAPDRVASAQTAAAEAMAKARARGAKIQTFKLP